LQFTPAIYSCFAPIIPMYSYIHFITISKSAKWVNTWKRRSWSGGVVGMIGYLAVVGEQPSNPCEHGWRDVKPTDKSFQIPHLKLFYYCSHHSILCRSHLCAPLWAITLLHKFPTLTILNRLPPSFPAHSFSPSTSTFYTDHTTRLYCSVAAPKISSQFQRKFRENFGRKDWILLKFCHSIQNF